MSHLNDFKNWYQSHIIHVSHENLVIEESHHYDFKPREHHGHENVII